MFPPSVVSRTVRAGIGRSSGESDRLARTPVLPVLLAHTTMSEISTKPYLLRAIYEWCTDSGFTPYLAVKVDGSTTVPMEYVRKGEIILNISFGATSALKMDNDAVHFRARFNGVSREIYIPVHNVLAIYANENGQGMAFEVGALPAASSRLRGQRCRRCHRRAWIRRWCRIRKCLPLRQVAMTNHRRRVDDRPSRGSNSV